MLNGDRYAPLRSLLSIHTRQSFERGPLEDAKGSSPLINERNFEQIAESLDRITISQKVNATMRLIEKRTKFPGEAVRLNDNLDYPAMGLRSTQEVDYIMRYLRSRGLLSGHGSENVITPEGFEFLQPSGPGGVAGICFIAMSFDDELTPVLDQGIIPAVQADCGFSAVRLDRVPHNDNINDRILADIRSAQFMIADFTKHRGGVYFEAGFALALGRPVIFTCHRDDHNAVHFDTRPYNYIIWEDASDIRTKLTMRIRGSIPHAKLE